MLNTTKQYLFNSRKSGFKQNFRILQPNTLSAREWCLLLPLSGLSGNDASHQLSIPHTQHQASHCATSPCWGHRFLSLYYSLP